MLRVPSRTTRGTVTNERTAIDAEEVAAFVLAWAARLHGARAFVGRRPDPLVGSGLVRVSGSAIDRLASRGVRDLPDDARRALLGMFAGTHAATVYRRPLAAREVVALQAAGRRCVSLLDEHAPLGPYATPLGFCVHDLSHLAAFFDPAHARGQRGFFRALDRALDGDLEALLADHDPALRADVLAVGADTNGSCVFAFASLVMKLKMAVRRALGRRTGLVRERGPLTPEEETAFTPELRRFTRALGMPASLDEDAARVGTRRAFPEAARRVLLFFEETENS